MGNMILVLCTFLCVCACTPYGASRDTVRPLKEYRDFLTQDYERRAKQTVQRPAQKTLLNIHKLPWFQEIQKHAKKDQSDFLLLKDLYQKALEHSNQVRVFSDIPLIRETGIMEAEGDFDPIIFAEGGYNRINRPVTSVLEVGGTDNRLKENELYSEFGIRKKFAPGTRVELKEKLQRIQNNSEFFDPNPQSVATLTLSIIQPFLRGAGVEYNESVIRLAQLDTEIAKNEFKRQMESHLLEITRVYWTLYIAQMNLKLKVKSYERVQKIVAEMKQRGNFDALASQIYQTEANAAIHEAQIIRLQAEVKNTRDRLISLVNAPEYTEIKVENFIPLDLPVTNWAKIDMQKSIQRALSNRPELEQAYLQIRAATVRLNMSKNELLPVLDGILEFALSGLRAENDMEGAMGDQFSEGNLGVRVGFRFEFPPPNNVARARHLRKEVEKRQVVSQFKTTAEGIAFEVQVSVREVQTAYQEFIAQQAAYIASVKELESLSKRRVLETVLEGQSTSYFLQLLLQAENRHVDVQARLIKSMIDYNLALTNLKRAEGTFLAFERLRKEKKQDEKGLPTWETILDESLDAYNLQKNVRIFEDNERQFRYDTREKQENK
ncbi:TolC family protein [Candidatus Uabimicrobium amorphum]|uniref:Outer membrane channel protein n=1 Tax=Uabimicrobium amorphum TaxID=2596890 RepID=A0A5S9INQ4_UABAM|nr:TolC family protein [Candidatus Uabimicrobium amorphum]BBM85278.1 outer membrane channel protein [Candidatus Uabimicrobium amorphum]